MKRFIKQLFTKHQKPTKYIDSDVLDDHPSSFIHVFGDPYRLYDISGEELILTTMYKSFVTYNLDFIKNNQGSITDATNNIILYDIFKKWYYGNYAGFALPSTAALYYCFDNTNF